jgi:SAM-dependent methyltransferase
VTDADRELVRRGYDVISSSYRDDEGCANPTTDEDVDRYVGWIEELAAMLAPGALVLDLGCGCGLPATRLLVERGFDVVGIDFSAVQVERARRLVPEATFIQADMAEWEAEPGCFDAIVSFYALIHVPLADQMALFPGIRRWLRSGGLFLAIVGSERWTGVEDYLGTPMFWDHADNATYVEWLERAGLRPQWNRFIPEGDAGHTLVLAVAQ